MFIRLKRAYAEAAEDDGFRVLVDRIWPRGIKKEEANLDDWMKEIAPSSKLRKWFNHEPDKWDDFRAQYFEELDKNPGVVEEIAEKARSGTVTLVYAAKNEEYNNAVALKEYLKIKYDL